MDLVVEGKPIEKLIEVVSNAIGTLYEPRQLVRVARAEAEAERIKAIEGAKTEALLANNEERYAELSAMEKRIVAKESKRQNNINNVVAIAAQSLKDDKDVSSEPVSPDWTTRFFDIAQDISDETMQDLWARILAGEVKRPKSYSLRTLEALRNITSEEAHLFEKIAQYILYDGSYYIYRDSFEDFPDVDFKYPDIARLMEMGLIQAGSMVEQVYYNASNINTEHHMYYGKGYVAFVEMPANLPKLSFPVYPLTHVGEELMYLISIDPKRVYFEYVLQKILEENKHLSKDIHIKYALLNSIDFEKGKFEYDEDSVKEISLKSSASK